MKKIIILLLLISSIIYAQNNTIVENIWLLKTNKILSIKDIKTNKEFTNLTKEEKFNNPKTNYWIKIKLNQQAKNGTYLILHGLIDFDINTISNKQNFYRIEGGTGKIFSFNYNKSRDEQYYYFHILTPVVPKITSDIFVKIMTEKEYHNTIQEYLWYLVFYGIAMGIILMAGLYNLFMFYYNREISFLYYSLMQFSMVVLQFFFTELIEYSEIALKINYIFGSLTAFFATIFTRSFFNTKKYFAYLDKLLYAYMIILIVDICINILLNTELMVEYHIYSIFGSIYILISYKRLKQGFHPAIFFLIGWSALVFSLIAADIFNDYLTFNIFILGSVTEALLLAIALSYKIKLIENEKDEQNVLMLHQSKLASMGEMLGNIAHQWRQPLTHLSYSIMNIEDSFIHNTLDKKYLNKKVNEANTQISFMSQTIDDFKDFYKVDKAKEYFFFTHELKNILQMITQTIKEKNIKVILETIEDSKVKNYKNEYKQVLINILSNAIDILEERKIINPTITITINKNVVLVKDNAGGINIENINKIFEPYFTTKEKNSGIGLYMSKMIIEKNMGGKLIAYNDNNGAIFEICVK